MRRDDLIRIRHMLDGYLPPVIAVLEKIVQKEDKDRKS